MTLVSLNNQLFVLPNEFHHLMKGRRHISSQIYERPPQKKVIAGVNVEDLKLCAKFCWTLLDDLIHRSQRISMHLIKGSYIDLVLL